MPFILYLSRNTCPHPIDVVVDFRNLHLGKEASVSPHHFQDFLKHYRFPTRRRDRRRAVDFTDLRIGQDGFHTVDEAISALLGVFYNVHGAEKAAIPTATDGATTKRAWDGHQGRVARSHSIRVVLPSKLGQLSDKPSYRYCEALPPVDTMLLQVSFNRARSPRPVSAGSLAIQLHRRLLQSVSEEDVPVEKDLWARLVDLCQAANSLQGPLSATISFPGNRGKGHATPQLVESPSSRLKGYLPSVIDFINLDLLARVASAVKWAQCIHRPDPKPPFCQVWYKEFPAQPTIERFSAIDYGKWRLDDYRDMFRTIEKSLPGEPEVSEMRLHRVRLPLLGLPRRRGALTYPSVTELQYHIFREDQLTDLRATLGHFFPGLRKLIIIIGWPLHDDDAGDAAAQGTPDEGVLAAGNANFTLGRDDVTVRAMDVPRCAHPPPATDSERVWVALGPFQKSQKDASRGGLGMQPGTGDSVSTGSTGITPDPDEGL